MVLNNDFKEFFQLLNKHNVKYLVIGGYAVAFHGHPRYTKDIDICIVIDKDNAKNIIQALKDFGFGSLGLSHKDFLTPEQIIQLGYPPNRIDILTSLKGVNLEECYENKVTELIDDVPIHFIDLENLKKNKLASGRLQDLADVENLQ